MFHCLDARSGAQMWAQQVSTGKNNQVNSTAAIYNDMVVVASNHAQVVAYDTATGRRVWMQSTDGPCTTELLVQAGKIWAATAASIYSLDAPTGEILFHKSWPHMAVHTFTQAPESTFVVIHAAWEGRDQPARPAPTDRRVMLAFDGTTERFRVEAAEFLVGMRFDNVSGLIYESRFDGIGIIDPSTGQRLHNIHSDTEVIGYGLVHSHAGRIYAMDMRRSMYCLRCPTSERRPDHAENKKT